LEISAFGLIFVAIGTVIFISPKLLDAARIPYLPFRSQVIFRYGFLGFGLLWTALAFGGTYSVYLHHKSLARDNRCRVAEGRVEQFVPMPYAGHAEESFTVSGVPFKYSDFIVTDAFNNTSSHGGPLTGDSYVRICYDPASNAILRLEIRDFKGERKDYAAADGFFPTAEDARRFAEKGPAPMAWYDNLFEVFFVLDLVAIYALYLPYLRTFLRLKTAAVVDCRIPRTLDAGKKIKLRNSMIYWDGDNRAIWLRPRGLVVLQLPHTIAKLTVDEYDRSIRDSEIRFSSGFAVVMVLFFWTAYRLFSSAPLGPPQLAFLGIAAVTFVIGGFLHLRRLRSHMDNLVQHALAEIAAM
jgi:hypothetical protein